MEEIGYVYFILQTSKETNEQFYKIGYTNNPEKRIRELKTGNPNTLELKYIIENVSMSFEKHMHGICQQYRVEGEWFKVGVMDHLLVNNSPWFKKNILRYGKNKS